MFHYQIAMRKYKVTIFPTQKRKNNEKEKKENETLLSIFKLRFNNLISCNIYLPNTYHLSLKNFIS